MSARGDRAAGSACAFSGRTAQLTRERVLGDWLSRIGLDMNPVPYRAGPLNRLGRHLGVQRPFSQAVREVCAGQSGEARSQAARGVKKGLAPAPGSIS